MQNRDKIISLYDIYKDLLTENQREYFENYYFEDLSMSEISENLSVSKAFVGKTIKIIEEKLYDYESKLKINERNDKIHKLLVETDNDNLRSKIEELL